MALLRILDCHVFLVNKNELRQELFIVNASRKSARGKQKGPSLFFCSIDMNLNENLNWNKNLCKMKYSCTMVLIFLSINSIFMIRPKRQRHLCTMAFRKFGLLFCFCCCCCCFHFSAFTTKTRGYLYNIFDKIFYFSNQQTVKSAKSVQHHWIDASFLIFYSSYSLRNIWCKQF